jgi:transposase
MIWPIVCDPWEQLTDRSIATLEVKFCRHWRRPFPSIEEEDAKRLRREVKRLVQERVKHVNRIKGLCALHGIYDYQPIQADRKTQIEGLRTGDGRPLPPRLKAEIMRELGRLELVLQMIADVEAERDAIVKEATPQHPNADKIKLLTELSAIGPEFATRLVGEVFYRSFGFPAIPRRVASQQSASASPLPAEEIHTPNDHRLTRLI